MLGDTKVRDLVEKTIAYLDEHDELEEHTTIGMAALVFEIKSSNHSGIFVSCTDKRSWIQRALIAEGLEVLDTGTYVSDED